MFSLKLKVPLKLKLFYLASKLNNKRKSSTFSEDLPKKVRNGEELDLVKLKKYLLKINFDLNDVNQFPSGYSNLTYLLTSGSKEYILRKPPFGAESLKGGHDMLREFTVLKNLKSQFDLVPKVYHFCGDKSIIGSTFYLMERVKGNIIRPNLSEENSPGKKIIREISKQMINTLSTLHNVDIKAANLTDLGKINGYNQRQVDGWIKRYYHSKTSTIDNMEFVAKWLKNNIPMESKASIIHNDFKYDNIVLSKENFSRINAILDWEMATVGDPLMDLGTSLGYWVDNDDLPELKLFQLSATTLQGNPTREEFLHEYMLKSNTKIDNPIFYYVFGLFKIAVIAQQIFFRYKKGYTKDKRFKLLELAVISLSVMAKQSIEKNRLSNLF
mgnify:FL=1